MRLRVMRFVPFAVAGLLSTLSAPAADRADEVRAAETAFAKAFADRDAPKFLSFVAEDATFLSEDRVLSGWRQVMEGWSKYFQGKAPFSWRPGRVVVDGTGSLALSTGPIFDEAGRHTGDFSSVWRHEKDGTWRVVFDGPGAPVCAEKK
jgi:ketosteroid isomerase-like protein